MATLEEWYPLTLGVISGAAFSLFTRGDLRSPDQLMNAAVEGGGILAGFIMTAKSILVSAPENSYLRKLAEAGAIGALLKYMMRATYYALALVAASAFLLAAPEWVIAGHGAAFTLPAWIGLAVTALLATLRVAILFGGTIRAEQTLPRNDDHPPVNP